MSDPQVVFEIKPGQCHSVGLPEALVRHHFNDEASLRALFERVAEQVYCDAQKNERGFLPSAEGDGALADGFEARWSAALQGLRPLMRLPAAGMSPRDVERGLERAAGFIVTARSGPVDIQLTQEGFICEKSLRELGFERELTDLDLSLALLEAQEPPEGGLGAGERWARKRKGPR